MTRAALPFFLAIEVERSDSAEKTFGAGSWSCGEMMIVIVEPFTLPCSTALAEPESRNSISFLPITGWTLKVSGAGAFGFRTACALPDPANALLQMLGLSRIA